MLFCSDLPNDADMIHALGSMAIPCDLPEGDCCFWGVGENEVTLKICVERKKLGDLAACVLNGRYLFQAQNAKDAGMDVLILIAEVGDIRANLDDGLLEMRVWGINPRTLKRCEMWQPVRPTIMYSRLCQYLFELSRLAGIYVFRTGDVAETAAVIRSLYAWFQKRPDQHKSLCQMFKPAPPTVQLVRPSLVRRVAAELDGVGWEWSRVAAERFHTVREMMQAGVDDWAGLASVSPQGRRHRLGKKTAERVVAELG